MSDHELRRILSDIIDELDTGRLPSQVVHRCGPLSGARRGWFGSAALAGSLAAGLALGAGCIDRPVGRAEDGGLQDAGPAVDAPVLPPYMGPPSDAGPDVLYGGPVIDDADVDAGPIVDYGVPPDEEDAGSFPLYRAPDNDDDNDDN